MKIAVESPADIKHHEHHDLSKNACTNVKYSENKKPPMVIPATINTESGVAKLGTAMKSPYAVMINE